MLFHIKVEFVGPSPIQQLKAGPELLGKIYRYFSNGMLSIPSGSGWTLSFDVMAPFLDSAFNTATRRLRLFVTDFELPETDLDRDLSSICVAHVKE